MMQTMHRLSAMLLAMLVLSSTTGRADEKPPERPNILVIVSDNQGWRDIGYNGSEIRTPVLDRLAATGVRLDRNYVYSMCSPTRAAFISGRAPSRYGINGAIGGRSQLKLPPETVTVADSLKANGYETAITGKWHVSLRPEYGPRQYGFDVSYGFLHGQIEKLTHRYKNGDRTWHRNDQFVDEEGHSLDLITAEATKFISKKRDKPFFLYVPFGAPHPPLQDDDKWIKPYEQEIADPSRRAYAASVTHMDAAIGQLIAMLGRTGQRENTLVVFFSDNGAIQKLAKRPQDYAGRFGPYQKLGDNGSLRGWIGELYDGCLRTPALANWPGVLKPGVIDEVTSVLDWHPTFIALAGGTADGQLRLEGRNIWPKLSGRDELDPIVLYWKNYNGKRAAVRDGKWKLVIDRHTGEQELFDMEGDPNEQQNVTSKNPQRVRVLMALLEQQAALDK